jgi:Bacterial dnaA protein helix-turn-helix
MSLQFTAGEPQTAAEVRARALVVQQRRENSRRLALGVPATVHVPAVRKPMRKLPPLPEPFPVPRWFFDVPLPPRRVRIADIIAAVCVHCGVKKSDLLSHRRTPDLVGPRHLAMYLARETTDLAYPAIGRLLGDRDHTTILYGSRKVAARMAVDPEFRADVELIAKRIREGDFGKARGDAQDASGMVGCTLTPPTLETLTGGALERDGGGV